MACITEGGEFIILGRGRGSGVRVGFFVVMVWKVIEGLKGGGIVRMVRNSIVGSGIQVL